MISLLKVLNHLKNMLLYMFEKLDISLLVKLKDSKLYIKIGTHFVASKDSETFSSVFVPILLKIELSAPTNLAWMG